MKTHLKMTRPLLAAVRADLVRPHPYAWERVGFLFAGVVGTANGVTLLAQSYYPVADDDYLRDHSVGAMMGPGAIRTALQVALRTGTAALHVHMHEHAGRPNFSGVDLRENAKFVPDFFKVAPQTPHGAVVLSHDGAQGQVWLDRHQRPRWIDAFTVVGLPLARHGDLQ